jgi:hypothetical protein
MRNLSGIFIIFVLLVSMSNCIEQEEKHITGTRDESFPLKGVSLSPRSFQPDDFTDFFEKAVLAGEVVSWAGDWNELGTEKGGPAVVTTLASTYTYTPLVLVQFFTQSTGQLLRPLNEATENTYLTSAVTFAQAYTPQYLGFGIEVNVLYQKSPSDFNEFMSFYREVYDAVKAVSPSTTVFTVFQLERMKGLNDGLYGGTNDPDTAHWFLLDEFPSDIAAFTTYPGLVYKTPADIPADYYTEIQQHTQKPIAFVEIGWHTDSSPSGWESSESEQAKFVETFFRLTKELDMELAIWSFLYDQDISEPFKSMGLYSSDGHAKQAWDIWINNERKYHVMGIF